MQMTRREFVSWLGASTMLEGSSLAYAAASPAEALSTLLRDGKSNAEKEKPAHGPVDSQTERPVVEY